VRARWRWVLLACAVFAAAGLAPRPLEAPDEIRVAEIAREMSASGDLLVPRLAGVPFLEHPPLYYAAVAGAFRLLGVSDSVARLPSALATFALLVLVFDLGRRLAGDRAGALAVAMLASMFGMRRYGHDCMVDSWLALAAGLGYWAYGRLLLDDAQDGRRPSPRLLLGVYAAAALGFLVKGPIGPLIVGLPLLVHAGLSRRRALLRSPVHLVALPLLLAVCAAWPALLAAYQGRAAFDEWWQENTLDRFSPDEDYGGGHVHGPLFYLWEFPGLALPWIVALPFVLRWLLRLRPAEGGPWPAARLRALRAMGVTCAAGLLLLSASGSKRNLYALPLLAPLAWITASWAGSAAARWRRPLSVAAWLAFAVSAAAAALPLFTPELKRDLSAFPRELAAAWRLDDVVGYQLSERVRAIVPLRTGTILPDARDEAELEQLLARRGGAKLLVESAALAELPAPVARRLRELQHWSIGRLDIALYDLGDPEEAPSRGNVTTTAAPPPSR